MKKSTTGAAANGPSEPDLQNTCSILTDLNATLEPSNGLRGLKAAENILLRGDVLKFLVRQAQRNHVGDTDAIKHLLASIASTNSQTSAGIQPELNGEKGKGKTDCCLSVLHLIPEKWKLRASVSAKSLYYYPDLPTGAIIFSDDVEWSTDLIATVKRSMGSFQESQQHITLDKNRQPMAHTMPARLAWWLSSVESVADGQLKDRQFSLDIDEGFDHADKVSDFLRLSRSKKTVKFSIDWRIEVARYIIDQIKSHAAFKVVIPCAKVAAWHINGDHRTQNKFWDLVEALAIIRYKQRHIDEEGWLHASVEDFNEARSIFMRRKANHRTHLTNAQAEVVKAVCRLCKESDGATQKTIAQALMKSQQAISKSLMAIMANTTYLVSDKGEYGEQFYHSTVIDLEFAFSEGDIVTLPKGYEDPYNRHTTPLQPLYNYHTTNEINSSKSIREDGTTKKEKYSEVALGISEGISDSWNNCSAGETGCEVVNPATDSDSLGCNEVVPGCTDAVPSSMTSEIQAGEARARTKEAKFKTPLSFIEVRFLKPLVRPFLGIDGKLHGPFAPEEVVSLPCLHARNFEAKGIACIVSSPEFKRPYLASDHFSNQEKGGTVA